MVLGQHSLPYWIARPRSDVNDGHAGCTVTFFSMWGWVGRITDPPGGCAGTFSAFMAPRKRSRWGRRREVALVSPGLRIDQCEVIVS